MTCPVPPLPQPSQTTGDDDDAGDSQQALAEFHIGIILDGLPTYRCLAVSFCDEPIGCIYMYVLLNVQNQWNVL